MLKDRDAFDKVVYNPVVTAANKVDLALSIGGDNYCYGVPRHIFLINKELRKSGIKTVLWGCSIEPESLQGQMLQDLKGYTYIFARENITYRALLEHGISQVSLFPDPAFILDKADIPLPNIFLEGETVGINLSPMVIRNECSAGMVFRNYCNLITHILNSTHFNIALIPHVVWSSNDDRVPLLNLFDEFKDTGRVVMFGDHSAEELKGIISRCRFMIAARTHASIAAYSTKVPTLVVGYSVKAKGIAEDLFGSSEKYVLPVQNIQDEYDLVRSFDWMSEKELEIRAHYDVVIPSYVSQLFGLKDIMRQICGG